MGGASSNSLVYAVPVSKKRDGETEVYRHPDHQQQLLVSPGPGLFTLQDIFLNAIKQFKFKKLLGWRETETGPFFWKTYGDCLSDAEHLGSGLIALNLPTHVNEYQNLDMNLIGIFSKNREEWLQLEYANYLYNLTMVPL